MDEHAIDGDTALVRALHTCDDGCDWKEWIVWYMNGRRRLSEHRFELPPARPQVVGPKIEPKKRPKRRRTRPATRDDE